MITMSVECFSYLGTTKLQMDNTRMLNRLVLIGSLSDSVGIFSQSKSSHQFALTRFPGLGSDYIKALQATGIRCVIAVIPPRFPDLLSCHTAESCRLSITPDPSHHASELPQATDVRGSSCALSSW